MKLILKDGVWPTMITPFTEAYDIDYAALEGLVEWYAANGADGLFAVCASSEMFTLSLAERCKLAAFVRERSNGRIQVIVSGHISYSLNDQAEEIKAIANTGVDAVVLVTNRLALEDQPDDVWKHNMEKLLDRTQGIPLGLYECPSPYQRPVSPGLLSWCAATGRFFFLKDTCCDVQQIQAKAEAVKGTGLKVYNAHSATLLESLKLGAAGFSGIMANIHPDLYAWLTGNWSKKAEAAENLQCFLGIASFMDTRLYPVNAKYYLQLEGLKLLLNSRVRSNSDFSPSRRMEVEQLHRLSKAYSWMYRNNLGSESVGQAE